ncbi:MAG: hypothetical protein FD147_2454, partial [Chloroflexi bacterium]
CVFLIAAVIIVPWTKTWQVLVTSDLILIGVAFLLTIPYQLLSTTSYCIVATGQKITFDFWYIFRINLIMVFYDIVLPSTFFVSGLRWYRYSKQTKSPSRTLTSIAYLKAFNILLTVLMSFGLLLFFDSKTIKGYIFEIVALIVGIALILFFTPLICKNLTHKLPQTMDVSSKSLTKFLLYKYFYKILSAFANFQNLNFKSQLFLITIGIASQGIQYYAYIIFAESVGIHLTYAQLGTLRAILLLVANLPINFSVGIGLREVTLVSLLAVMDIPLEKAAAMSLVVFAKSLFYGLIGGIMEAILLINNKKTDAKLNIQ